MRSSSAWVSAASTRQGEIWRVRGPARLEGTLRPPGDKSIAHRLLLAAALARGTCSLRRMPDGEDVARTRDVLRALGVRIEVQGGEWRVHGVGLQGLRAARQPLDCGNSGTTMRLMAGLLAGQPFESVLTGDASLSRRPMARVATPLASMGARITCLGPNGRPPLRVGGVTRLVGRTHRLEIDSAQVRSAILLAGLWAEGPTRIGPTASSRDHTERLLEHLGVQIERASNALVLYPTTREGWSGFEVDVPGDVSSALFAIAAASARPGSRLRIEALGLNPGRCRALEILQKSGAPLAFEPRGASLGEPWGTLHVAGGALGDLRLGGADVVRCLDEVPALVAAWALAGRRVQLRDAAELRVKESDRLAALAKVLAAFGVRAVERRDGLDVEAATGLRPGNVDSRGDHRIAMAAAMLALGVPGTSRIEDVGCVRTSYPGFAADVNRLAQPARQATDRNGASGKSAPRSAARARRQGRHTRA